MIRTFLVIAFLAVMGGNALAQSTPPPVAPAGMSQVQFDALVGAISDSVTEKLKEAKPAPAAKGAKAPPAPKIVKMPPREGPDAFAVFIERAGVVLAAFPVMLDKLATIPGLLDRDAAGGGRSLGNYLMLLGAVVVVAVASEAALRQLLFALRHRLAATAPASFGNQSLKSLGGLALVDGVGVAMVWLICHLAKGAWFNADIGQDKFAAAVLIALIALMISLQDFGINIAPLIAGASVFGIAISFGSQTLVKDIVSGLFYLSDDAFRVGEYIDAGKAKGTVEGFTLRSIKLRHQNGQVHTVPFGQLGQITNFSRDWITMKFNLRFARDTDLEKLRKAAKKIGTEIAEMPQFKDEVLAPFKMQGVYDIVESAILVRFKFTARPGNPSAIQREAVKRMVSDLPALGIEFAKEGAAVVLHTGAMDAPKPEAVTVAAPAPAPAPDAKVAAAAS